MIDRELQLLTESEFCPPIHLRIVVCPINSYFIISCRKLTHLFLFIQVCNKRTGGTEFRLCQDWSGTFTFLTESEFCPPIHLRIVVCPINSDFFTFHIVKLSVHISLTFLLLSNQLIHLRTGGTEFRLCQGLPRTLANDRIGILSSRTSEEFCLSNKFRFSYFSYC